MRLARLARWRLLLVLERSEEEEQPKSVPRQFSETRQKISSMYAFPSVLALSVYVASFLGRVRRSYRKPVGDSSQHRERERERQPSRARSPGHDGPWGLARA